MRVLLLVFAVCTLAACAEMNRNLTERDFDDAGTVNIYGGQCLHGLTRVLIAQGDSWFSYAPAGGKAINSSGSITDDLQDSGDNYPYPFCIPSVATAGKTLKQMNSQKELASLGLIFAELAKRGVRPEAILLSGGGDDAFSQIGTVLNDFSAAEPRYDIAKLDRIIAEILDDLEVQIGHIHDLKTRYFGNTEIPIIVNGYDYPVPDGREPGVLWAQLLEPKLAPEFLKKHYRLDGRRPHLEIALRVVQSIVDEYNLQLERKIKCMTAANVVYLDLRGTLSNQIAKNKYQEDWQNEIHPSELGFRKLMRKYDVELDALKAGHKKVAPEGCS